MCQWMFHINFGSAEIDVSRPGTNKLLKSCLRCNEYGNVTRDTRRVSLEPRTRQVH